MRTIKLRDFQRYLHRIIKEGGEDIRIVNKDNELLFSVVIPDGRAAVSQKLLNLNIEKIKMTVNPPILDGHAEESQIVEKTLKCDKCKKGESEWYGVVYEEGEDERTVGICDLCYRKFKPHNFKKI